MVTLLPASYMASSFEGCRTSQVAKLSWQKYWHGMPADFNSSSLTAPFEQRILTAPFLIPANLLVLKSIMIYDRVFGSTSVTSSGRESISVPLK